MLSTVTAITTRTYVTAAKRICNAWRNCLINSCALRRGTTWNPTIWHWTHRYAAKSERKYIPECPAHPRWPFFHTFIGMGRRGREIEVYPRHMKYLTPSRSSENSWWEGLLGPATSGKKLLGKNFFMLLRFKKTKIERQINYCPDIKRWNRQVHTHLTPVRSQYKVSRFNASFTYVTDLQLKKEKISSHRYNEEFCENLFTHWVTESELSKFVLKSPRKWHTHTLITLAPS